MSRGRKPTDENVVISKVLSAVQKGEKPSVSFLNRVLKNGLVIREKDDRIGRGRPKFSYSVSDAGKNWMKENMA